MSTESLESIINKKFKSIVKVFRFYIVLRRFGYIDPLVYSLDVNFLKDLIAQALREYHSYVSSAPQRKMSVFNIKSKKEEVVELPCLLEAKPGDIPEAYVNIYRDMVHKIADNNNYCVTPVMWDREGRSYLAMPTDIKIKEFLENLNNIEYARILAALAMGA
ncbi:hypothetical protein [Acidianus manzaensis]|uniref:Uncharacterized protein n=1 Tax=Acidianus manzaensis TaxID=282676 RepID=A0A1W6JWG8_9CREN|nr:hypothetical protein [Acidianus manzaensis]ARM74582.1 hypothetical protein B6F84_00085 [Acidianus manzaensis]